MKGTLVEGTWLAVGASVGLLAVVFGIRFGRQIRAGRQLADFSADNDPTRLVEKILFKIVASLHIFHFNFRSSP